MPELIAVTITKRVYAARGVQRGQSVPLMMENALKMSLGSVVQEVKHQLPGKRLAANTKLYIQQTPKGASAHLVIGEGVPFANVQAKWDNSPTEIVPKHPHKYLAIPLTSFGIGKMNAVKNSGGLRTYGKILHPTWFGKGERGKLLFWGKGNKAHFALAASVKVKPSVNLSEVNEEMRNAANAGIRSSFGRFDFGFVRMQKG